MTADSERVEFLNLAALAWAGEADPLSTPCPECGQRCWYAGYFKLIVCGVCGADFESPAP